MIDKAVGDGQGVTGYVENVKANIKDFQNASGRIDHRLIKNKLKISVTKAQEVKSLAENDLMKERIDRINKKLEEE